MKKIVLLATLFLGGSAHGGFLIDDDRLSEIVDGASKIEGSEAKVCRGGACFYASHGVLWFTDEAYAAWSDKSFQTEIMIVDSYDDYYNGDISFSEVRKPQKPQVSIEADIDRSGIGSGNDVTIHIGSGDGDRTCRSCHPKVHPGFGKKD